MRVRYKLRIAISMALVAVSCLLAGAAPAFEPLHDGFDVAARKPDTATWGTLIGAGSYLGATQLDPWPMRVGAVFPVTGGALRLTVESYNPSGFSWWGKHIVSHRDFQPTATHAVEVTFRMRVMGDSAGVVHSGYLYGCRDPAACAAVHDEIDIEIIQGRDGVPTLVLNAYADEPLGLGRPTHLTPAGWAPADFNTYKIVWSRTEIAFWLNDSLLATYRAPEFPVPQGPMRFNAISWVPTEETYNRAFSPLRKPSADPAANQTFTAELNAVTVRAITLKPAR